MTITQEDVSIHHSKSLDLVQTTKSMEEGQVVEDEEYVTQHNTAIFNQAIESLGFGRYQWKMFFTCGFGFLVDQVNLNHSYRICAVLTPDMIDARGIGRTRHPSDHEAVGCEVPQHVDSSALCWISCWCLTVRVPA